MDDVAARVSRLTKRFGALVAVDDVSFDVRPGEVLGCLGPNGAGKTTTLRLLLGMLRPTSGSVEIFGMDATSDAARAHRRLAYVPGEVSLWPGLTGAQTLDLLAGLHGGVDQVYRAQLIERFQLDPSRRVREYSKGNRQKVALIAALATRADLLVLDEPTSGLDPLMEREFRNVVGEARRRGQSVLLSSHILSEVDALSDRIAILRNGRLVDLGPLAAMRHLAALTVDATLPSSTASSAVCAQLAVLSGVASVERADAHVHCRVLGSVAPVLAVLAGAGISHLTCTEPTLEELFLDHYGAAAEQVS